jgi:shikimate dehydrogenase
MEKKIYGLIGFPLSHSFSKSYFENKFRTENIPGCVYNNFEISDIRELPDLLREPGISGLNITSPYKKQVIPYLDSIDDKALAIGAANCIKRINNKWKGFNTDITGFEKSLIPLLHKQHSKALVLGTGGAANAVSFVLDKLNIPVTKVSRIDQEGTLSFYDLDKNIIESHPLIINTTPLGSFPEINEAPDIPYQFLTESHLCYDLIYNPDLSLFLKNALQKGAMIKNGYEMLVIQAEESWRIWNTPE